MRVSLALFILTLMFSVVGCEKHYAGVYVLDGNTGKITWNLGRTGTNSF